MKKIQMSVGSVAQALDRFEHVWQQAEKGAVPAAQLRLSFESLPTLLKNLTPARWELLKRLKAAGPLTIFALAKLLERDYKNVHTDVARLIHLNLIEKKQDGQISVSWEAVRAELKL